MTFIIKDASVCEPGSVSRAHNESCHDVKAAERTDTFDGKFAIWMNRSRHSEPAGYPGSQTDEDLITAAQSGMPRAWEELVKRNHKIVYRTARRFAENAADADDLVQETMVRAFLNIDKFRGECRLSSWLLTIVMNAARSMKRKPSPSGWIYVDEQNESGDGRFAWRLRDPRRTPEEDYQRTEIRTLLRREIRRMHPKYRFILQECYLGEVSLHDAAKALGITHAAAKSRLHLARGLLSEAFRRHTLKRSHCGDRARSSYQLAEIG